MTMYQIGYSGWTTALVEASSQKEAEEKFWDEGLNDLCDANVEDVVVITDPAQAIDRAAAEAAFAEVQS